MGWHLLKGFSKPWVNIFSDLYLDRTQSLAQNRLLLTSSKGSINLRNYKVGKDIIERGLGWNVGNGLSLKVWTSNWFTTSSLRSLIQGPLHSYEEDLRVADLFDSNRG